MKINEVEAQVGITKKNIRFYEEQGLLSPKRNSENGYRDYGPAEVEVLRRIKLMRKLGVPLDILLVYPAVRLADRNTLAREQRSLEQSTELCRALRDREERLEALDAAALLEEMEHLEQAGATFRDKQKNDLKPARYAGAVVMALMITALMAALIILMVWSFIRDPDGAPPLPLIAVFAAVPGFIILGVLLALYQRIKEIQRGEADDAEKY